MIMEWAHSCGVKFVPSKYVIIHFIPPNCSTEVSKMPNQYPKSMEHSPPSLLMPSIPGLSVENNLKSEARVLGVWIDQRLNFERHIKEVRWMQSPEFLQAN